MKKDKRKLCKRIYFGILFLVNIFLLASCAENNDTANDEYYYVKQSDRSKRYDILSGVSKIINSDENIYLAGFGQNEYLCDRSICVLDLYSFETFSMDPEILNNICSEYSTYCYRIVDNFIIINACSLDTNKLIIADKNNYEIKDQADLEYGEGLSDCFVRETGDIEIIVCKQNQYGITAGSKIFDVSSCVIKNGTNYGFFKSQFSKFRYDSDSDELVILNSSIDEFGEIISVSFSRYSSDGEITFSSDIYSIEHEVYLNIFFNKSGNICFVYKNDDYSLYVDEYSLKDGSLLSGYELNISEEYNVVSLAAEKYDCICADDSYFYGYSVEENSMEKLMPVESDLDSTNYYESAGMLIADSETIEGTGEITVIDMDHEGKISDNITLSASSDSMVIDDIDIKDDQIYILENNKFDNSFCVRCSDWWNNSVDLFNGGSGLETEGLRLDKKGNIYLISSDKDNLLLNIDVYSSEGKKLFSSVFKDSYCFFDAVCCADDGIVLSYLNNDGKVIFSKLSEKKEEELFKTDLCFGNSISLCEGFDKYDFLYYSNESLCGFYNGKTEVLTTWNRSDLYLEFQKVCIMKNHDILAYANDLNENKTGMVYLSMADDKTVKQIKNKKEIVVGGNGIFSSDIINLVKIYNSENIKYHIVLKDYSNDIYFGEYRDDLEFLKDPPDIMIGDPDNDYLVKDYCIDLTEYLNKDIKKEDYFDNILRIYQNEDGIYKIPVSFDVTSIECTGDITAADYHDMIGFITLCKRSDLKTMNDSEKMKDILIYKNISAFIDMDSKKCDFNNDDFNALLELLKENNNKQNDEKNRFLEILSLCDLRKAVEFENKYGHEPKYTGIPGRTSCENIMNSDFTVSIFSNTKYKSEAWKFVKKFLEDEYQNGITNACPVLKDLLRNRMLSDRSDLYDMYGGSVIDPSGKMVTLKTMSDEYIDDTIIRKLEQVSRYDICDSHIEDILDDEITRFLSGDQSSDKTAEIIQNKISLYLNEKW